MLRVRVEWQGRWRGKGEARRVGGSGQEDA